MKRFPLGNPLTLLGPKSLRKLKLLEECSDLNFIKASEILGLDPEVDFRFSDLSGINFDLQDLNEFDFTGCVINNCSWEGTVPPQGIERKSDISNDSKSETPSMNEIGNEFSGLTPAEEKLLNIVKSGSSISEAANELGLTLARTYQLWNSIKQKLKEDRVFQMGDYLI